MKIQFKKGNKAEGDIITQIQTSKDNFETFSIHSLLLVMNQIALNEARLYKSFLEMGRPLYFEEASKDVIAYGRKGINLLDDKNEHLLISLAMTYKLQINKFKQKKLIEFLKDGSP